MVLRWMTERHGRSATPMPKVSLSSASGGWIVTINVVISSDSSVFVVNSLGSWRKETGLAAYPDATRIMINADSGSNGSRNRLWKKSLRNFANETGLEIHVSHFPPGTSKWNKIEHRMFSYSTFDGSELR